MPLTEYESAYGVDVKDLYAGEARLLKKVLLTIRAPALGRADFAHWTTQPDGWCRCYYGTPHPVR